MCFECRIFVENMITKQNKNYINTPQTHVNKEEEKNYEYWMVLKKGQTEIMYEYKLCTFRISIEQNTEN